MSNIDTKNEIIDINILPIPHGYKLQLEVEWIEEIRQSKNSGNDIVKSSLQSWIIENIFTMHQEALILI